MANKKKNSTWNDILKPVVVLTVICLVVSGILAAVNNITSPIIAKNAALAADAARIELLPEATDGFDKVEDVDMEGVKEVYKAKNGSGYTITAFGKGYGGEVVYMVAFDSDGKIVNLKVLEHAETQGLGSKIENPEFLEKFKGTDKDLTSDDINMISGATISSNASLKAVNNARKAFNQYAKGIVVVELTLEEKLGLLFGEGAPAVVETTEYSNDAAKAFYKSENGVVIAVEGEGFASTQGGEPITVYTAFNEDGTIAGVHFEASNDVPGGDKLASEKYNEQFIGKTNTDGIDTIAGVTFTSTAALESVAKACEIFAAI